MMSLLRRAFARNSSAAGVLEAARVDSDAVIARVRGENLSYCGRPKMENLRDAALRVRAEGVPGSFLECGVALGGSAIMLAKVKEPARELALYDVFAMIPPPGPQDSEDAHRRYAEIASGASAGLGGQTYYGYVDNLIEQVQRNMRAFGIEPGRDGVRFVKGLFEDTLHPQGPVALAHIDCDWYDPVRTCIDRILPRLSFGGILVFDDYSSYAGCTRAVDEMLAANPQLERIFLARSIGVRRSA